VTGATPDQREAFMHSRARVGGPHRLLEQLRAPLALPGLPGLMPALRAFGSLRPRRIGGAITPDTLGRIGSLEVRLAHSAADVRQAQRLRYQVFYEEMAAIADARAQFARRDIDSFDAVCDHLLVVDHAEPHGRGGHPAVVGTYRLLLQHVAERHGGFYSASEFDVPTLLARHRDVAFLELGRSCVLAPYRTKRTVELLWHGIWTYVLRHRVDAMIGCASLEGTDPGRLALPLSFLHHHARAPEAWRTQARPERRVEMNRIAKEMIDPKRALHALPPLIKGYLRVGATVADGAVVDRQFGTTDVFIVLPVAGIEARYIAHFGAGAERHAA
jgi:L-ornithine Nalpha-acyltransferase